MSAMVSLSPAMKGLLPMRPSLALAAISTGITAIWAVDRDDFETYRLPGRKRFKLA